MKVQSAREVMIVIGYMEFPTFCCCKPIKPIDRASQS